MRSGYAYHCDRMGWELGGDGEMLETQGVGTVALEVEAVIREARVSYVMCVTFVLSENYV